MVIFEEEANILNRKKKWRQDRKNKGKIAKKQKQRRKSSLEEMRIILFSEEGKSQWMNVGRSGIEFWVHPCRAVWLWMKPSTSVSTSVKWDQ